MIPPLYNALLSGDFPTLSKLLIELNCGRPRIKRHGLRGIERGKCGVARVVKGRVEELVFRSPLITKIEGAKGEDSLKLPQCNQHL